MPSQVQFPPAEDVERLGNLLLSAWSPPPSEAFAEAWLESAIAAFIDRSEGVFLLGHRPGKVQHLPQGALTDQTRLLLEAAYPEPSLGPLYHVPPEAARSSVALLRPGDIIVRRRVRDEATGIDRVESTHLGRLLVLSSVAVALRTIQSIAIRAPLQVHLSCLTNPSAGLRQPDARWLRAIKDWEGERVAISWLGTSLSLFAGRQALLQLRTELLGWLPAPAGEA